MSDSALENIDPNRNGSDSTPPSAAAVRELVLVAVSGPLAAMGLAPADVPDDFDLIAGGTIDSLGMLELIGAIEDHFGIEIDFEQLDADLFTVLGPLCRYVEAAAQAGAR